VFEKKLSNHVTFLGSLIDITSAYDAADALIHTAKTEPFGLVLLEAMARGLPIFANAALPAARYILGHNAPDSLCSVTDSDTFARAIVTLARDPEDYRRRSRQSTTRALDFGLPSYIQKLERIYSIALGRGGPR
jgi:glycosyltransferase involved in cell wall biosynthesis